MEIDIPVAGRIVVEAVIFAAKQGRETKVNKSNIIIPTLAFFITLSPP